MPTVVVILIFIVDLYAIYSGVAELRGALSDVGRQGPFVPMFRSNFSVGGLSVSLTSGHRRRNRGHWGHVPPKILQ